MSINDKIIDAQLLYANGRKEGALLSILVAVAATSRKRYPSGTKTDHKAFTDFLAEEMPKVTRIQNFNVKYRNKMVSIQELFYKYVRCNLTHEAELPDDIRFETSDQLFVNVDDDCITFSDRLIDVLATVVCNAEENSNEFGEVILNTKGD